MIRGTEAEYQSDAGCTKDTPYLILMRELWGVFCDYLREKWARYNGTALYFAKIMVEWVNPSEEAVKLWYRQWCTNPGSIGRYNSLELDNFG